MDQLNRSSIAFSNPGTGELVTLARPISAIQLVEKEEGGAKLGPLAQLSPGTVVERCGLGYNDRTTKVRANGTTYFVFEQDLMLLPS